MSILKNKKINGFSLIEVLIAISLNLLVVVMIIGIVIPGLKHVRMIRNERTLQSATQSLITQFNYWIKQGATIQVLPANPGDELRISLGSSTTTIKTPLPPDDNRITINNGIDTYYLTGDNIKVDSLVFTEMDHSVRIAFTLSTGVPATTFSATTTVAQRNSF